MISKNKDVAQTFDNQRKCILSESKITSNPLQNSDTSIIRILRSSKKNTDVYYSIKALSAYTFKLIKTKDSIKVERFYKAKDILDACAIYEQSECIPAFIDSVALEHRTKALKIISDSILRAEENVTLLNETLKVLNEDIKLHEVYSKKLELVKSSLAKKVALLQIAKNL